MDVVVLTFPGHFLQTHLCLRSIQRHYGLGCSYTIFYDDLSLGPWQDFAQDLGTGAGQMLPGAVIDIRPYTDLAGIEHCDSGWWRQQLIKLHIDQIMPGTQWLLVDGDVVFDHACARHNVIPVSFRNQGESEPINVLARNYCQNLLGIESARFEVQGRWALTSPVPFRYLDRSFLASLRQHVEQRFSKNFLDLHLDWFADQTILGFEDPPTRMIMTEWELIEHFRVQVQRSDWPFVEYGSGYPITADTSQCHPETARYRHGYARDIEIDRAWWQEQDIGLTNDLWHKCDTWMRTVEPHRYQ